MNFRFNSLAMVPSIDDTKSAGVVINQNIGVNASDNPGKAVWQLPRLIIRR
jgi:hypothetical protein